jgi:hypothetical protein
MHFTAAGMLAFAIPFLSGCASPGMKGTPFYTGEYENRKGSAENRVNIWPLLYYRDPALSVLWPFIELTDDHFAVRPLYSVYGLDGTQREHNVLWPVSQFDQRSGDSRIFPFFWGKDYQVAFPVYWNFGNALGRGGVNSLFPLWILDRDKHKYSFDTLWPVFHFDNLRSEKGSWRTWPITGHSWSKYDDYRFYAWPLGHIWEDKKNKISGSALFPFYFHRKMPRQENFVSLPYSFSRADDTRWDFSPPLFYRFNSPDRSCLYSLPYWSSSNLKNGDYWRLVPPFYYDGKDGQTRRIATLLGGWESDGTRTSWLAVPLLIGGTHSPDSGSFFAGGVLGHAAWQKEKDGSSRMKTHHVLPLYYKDHRSGTFLSLPYSTWKSGSVDRKVFPLLLSSLSRESDRNSLRVLLGLISADWGKGTNQHWVFPLYAYRDDYFYTPVAGWNNDGCVYFLTPLVGIKNGEDKGFWIFPLFRYSREASGDISGNFLLWGDFCMRDDYTRAGLFPLFSYTNLGPEAPPPEGKSGYSDYGKELSVLLMAWYKNQGSIHRKNGSEAASLETTRQRSNGIFPIWAYDSVVNEGHTRRSADRQLPFYLWQYRQSVSHGADTRKDEFGLLFKMIHSESQIDNKAGTLKEKKSLLYFLYDSLRDKKPAVAGRSARDYTRRRVLWRVYHYEKDNEDISVDVFPGITYDRKENGYKKFSFLYRLFAYENTGERTKVHVLFIPVKR